MGGSNHLVHCILNHQHQRQFKARSIQSNLQKNHVVTSADLLQTRVLKCEHCQILAKGNLNLIPTQDFIVSLEITQDMWSDFPLILKVKVCFRLQQERLTEACKVIGRDDASKKKWLFLLGQFASSLRLQHAASAGMTAAPRTFRLA